MSGTSKLVDAEGLREAIFEAASRPHVETVMKWARQRIIPSKKIGRNRFFDVAEVRAAIRERHTIGVSRRKR